MVTCMYSIGYILRKASLFITGAELWRMKMVLGKGLESNQREHCCVVGGERSDIWERREVFLRSQQQRTWLSFPRHILYFVVTWAAKFGQNPKLD